MRTMQQGLEYAQSVPPIFAATLGPDGGTSVPSPANPSAFAWETDPFGTIRWVDHPAREAVVGENIFAGGENAHAGGIRPHFSDLTLHIPGAGSLAGGWVLGGEAIFDGENARFLGYAGRAARVAPVGGLPGSGEKLSPDALRELIHELRTPLNAIMGFAELIDGRLEEADELRRARTGRILAEGTRLLGAAEEIDAAACTISEASGADGQYGRCAVDRLDALTSAIPAREGAGLWWGEARNVPLTRLPQDVAEQLIARLAAIALGYARAGEQLSGEILTASLGGTPRLCVALTRPGALTSAALETDGFMYEPPGSWPFAPALGLNFAWSLLAAMAATLGAKVEARERRLLLHLPAITSVP